jgi:hypothetical protein
MSPNPEKSKVFLPAAGGDFVSYPCRQTGSLLPSEVLHFFHQGKKWK